MTTQPGRAPGNAVMIRAGVALLIGILIGGGIWLARRRDGEGSVEYNAGSAMPLGGSGAAQGARPSLPDVVGLTGSVVDGMGRPVEGASLTAWPEAADVSAANPPAPTTGVTATTDAAGLFAIGGLAAGKHRVRIEGRGVLAAELSAVVVPTDALRIVVARRVDVRGAVRYGARDLVGAMVYIRSDELGGTLTTVTDALGAFAFDDLPEATYQVWASRDDLAVRAVRVPRLGPGPFAEVDLLVEPGAVVVGRVVELGDHARMAAAVELRPALGDDEPSRYVRTDIDGVFRFEGVPHGRWVADAYSPGFVAVGAVEFEAGRGVIEIELAAGAIVEGRVLGSGGEPIMGASVTTRSSEKGAAGERSAAIASDELRRFAGLSLTATPNGFLSGGLSDPLFVERGELGVVMGPIPLPPLNGGVFVDVAGAPSIKSPIRAPDPRLIEPAPLINRVPAAKWTTDSEGRYRVTGLPRGTFVVSARAPGLAAGRSEPVRTSLGQRLTDVDVMLSAGTFVEGTVRSSDGEAVVGAVVSLELTSGDPASLQIVSDENGGFRLGPAVGNATLRAFFHGKGAAAKLLALPSAKGAVAEVMSVDLVLIADDAEAFGEVLDPTGLPARGARVTVVGGPAAGRSALVDDAGFRLDHVPAGTIAVRVEHPDYPWIEAELRTGVAARIIFEFGGAIAGMVFDHHTGAMLPSVAVVARGPRHDRRELSTGPDGRFAISGIAAGTWTVDVDRSGYLPSSQTVDVEAAVRLGVVTRDDVRLELSRGCLLAGEVRDRRGARVVGATVTVRDAEAGAARRQAEARTDADGQFRIRDAPTGSLTIQATAADGETGSIAVETRPGDENLSVRVNLR